ncbi:MAG TPA: hypothetical protein PLS03_16230 [Terrimicrobiaceae bacterium]|nr:hypothetical protein [Terrimicrobiaceae bacterium]
MKTKLGSVALFAAAAVMAVKAPLFACYRNEMRPAQTFTSKSPACELIGSVCNGQWNEYRLPAFPHCTHAEAGGDACESFNAQMVAVITTQHCVYNVLQEDCLLGFTETEVEILNTKYLLASGAVCPEPPDEGEE